MSTPVVYAGTNDGFLTSYGTYDLSLTITYTSSLPVAGMPLHKQLIRMFG